MALQTDGGLFALESPFLQGIHADLAKSLANMATSAMPVGIDGSSRKQSKMPPPTASGRILMVRRSCVPPTIGGLLVYIKRNTVSIASSNFSS